jgi:hypothetical protein
LKTSAYFFWNISRVTTADDVGDFLVGRPDVLQVDRLAVLPGAERLGGQVDVHRRPASA